MGPRSLRWRLGLAYAAIIVVALAATLVAVNGRDLGPIGSGVITREFTAQT